MAGSLARKPGNADGAFERLGRHPPLQDAVQELKDEGGVLAVLVEGFAQSLGEGEPRGDLLVLGQETHANTPGGAFITGALEDRREIDAVLLTVAKVLENHRLAA